MEITRLRPEAHEWSALLEEAEHDFYHLPKYVALCGREDGAEAGALLVRDGGRRMLLPILIRDIDAQRRDAASPYGYPGPLLSGTDDPGFFGEAIAAARQTLAGEGIVTLFVRGHPLLGPPLDAPAATIVEHGLTLSIDLTLPPDVLWRQTMSGHRKDIDRARRLGHRAWLDDRFEYLGAFARIYRQTMERVHAASSYLFTEDYFAGLRDALGERLHLCFASIGDEIAGAALFVETGGLVQYHLSGTDDRFVQERPTKLILHFMREWAQQRGCHRFHLGGGVGGQEDSLFKFKAGFATSRHPFRTLRLVCDEAAYGELVAATHPLADPADRSGFFPLYRKAP